MLPDSISAIAIFFLFVAPGLLYQNLQMRLARRGGKELLPFTEEPLRAAGRVVLASGWFTAISVAILVIARTFNPELLPDPQPWIQDGHNYVANNYGLIAQAVALEVLIAFLLAVVAAQVAGGRSLRAGYNSWDRLFHIMVPERSRPYVRIQLKNGTFYSGFVHSYSRSLTLLDRELVLASPIYIETEEGISVLRDFNSIVLTASEIAAISVTYRLEDGTVVRRPTVNFVYRLPDGTMVTEPRSKAISRDRPDREPELIP